MNDKRVAAGLRRSAYRYRQWTNCNQEIVKLLLELTNERPEQGLGKLFERMRRRGQRWNNKGVYRVYYGLELNKRRKGKRRLPTSNLAPLGDIEVDLNLPTERVVRVPERIAAKRSRCRRR